MAQDPAPSADQSALLDWGRSTRRDLPWRRSRDPWEILVAEVMLAQTQVDRVVPKWHAFLARWPDVRTAAAAQLAEVLEVWQGLGYPRRAKYLIASARVVVDDHGGAVPADLDALLALPGVGPYTARAVLAFAFEQDVAVVDTNVGRILARRGGRRLGPRDAQSAADDLVPAGAGWEWNQSMLDLGALRCRPGVPACDGCPFGPTCAWSLDGRPEPDPATGSAAVSRPQSRFEGSLRQARGRVLRAAGEAPLTDEVLYEVTGWGSDDEAQARSRDVAQSLVDDGLAQRDDHGRLVIAAG